MSWTASQVEDAVARAGPDVLGHEAPVRPVGPERPLEREVRRRPRQDRACSGGDLPHGAPIIGAAYNRGLAVLSVAVPAVEERRTAAQRLLPWAACVAFLSVASYLYTAYRYDVWPQPGFLAHVLRYNGELRGDWFTSLSPGHWALDHALGVLPPSWLEPVVAILWGLTTIVLWAGFAAIADSFRLPPWTAALAGLVLLHTWLGGFGFSEMLAGYFYPSNLAFALSVAAIAFALRDRYAWAGAGVGLATLIHVGLGPLVVLVAGPIVLWQSTDRRRDLLRFAVPAAVLGGPAVVQLLLDTTSGGQLSPRETYEFLTVVRQPHHMLYSAFTTEEYVRTGLWALGVTGALAVLWSLRPARSIALVLGVIAATCAAGAVSSAIGWPLLLVEAQTARLSSYVVLLAVIALAAALHRRQPTVAIVVLALTFLLAPRFVDNWVARVPDLVDAIGVSAVEALALGGSLAVLVIIDRLAPSRSAWPRAAPYVAMGAIAACAISLIALRDERVPQASQVERDYVDVARQAAARTTPGALIVTPPQMDGFRSHAARANVVEFGSIRLGHGDGEWRKRVTDLTGDPAVLDPDAFGPDLARRYQAMDDGYTRTLTRSSSVPCDYGAELVVLRHGATTPTWLHAVYENPSWTLLEVVPGTCADDPQAAE